MSEEFKDYYEVLEVSKNANSFTIERVFRFQARRYHPDVADTGSRTKFAQIVEAYEVLRDSSARTKYDVELESQKQKTEDLVAESGNADSDTLLRHRMLTLFYAKRKRDMGNPGLGAGTLEQAFEVPADILDFHLWYFREKNWIRREESGLLSITADGVDQIEKRIMETSRANANKITKGVPRIGQSVASDSSSSMASAHA